MRFLLFIILCSLLTIFVGCGKGVRVSGKVHFSDGQPLTVGKVMFTDGTVTAFGKISPQGEYRMGTLKAGDGVLPGTYKVYITEANIEDASLSYKNDEGEMVAPLVLAVDPKFTDAAKSGLTCEVKGATSFDIQVEKPGKDYKPLPEREAAKPD